MGAREDEHYLPKRTAPLVEEREVSFDFIFVLISPSLSLHKWSVYSMLKFTNSIYSMLYTLR